MNNCLIRGLLQFCHRLLDSPNTAVSRCHPDMNKPASGQTVFNPWERLLDSNHRYKISADDEYYFNHLADKRPKFKTHSRNKYLDIDTKRAVLKASPSVVALVSYSGKEMLSQGCGTIIEADEGNMVTVITSANLIRRPTEEDVAENTLADNLMIVVQASDDNSYKGEICASDFHFNLLVIKFKSDTSLPVARLRAIDDCLSLGSFEEKSFELRPHSVKLEAGDPVIAVGRYFSMPFDIMAAPGCFSVDRCEYDCKELFLATCKITRCGDGGPLINFSGEVIGITFYDLVSLTPFLPTNIVQKWWEHHKKNGEMRHPYLGFEATSLYVADLALVERVTRRFPSISKGIIMEKVVAGSPAHSAGLQLDDVIIKCNGNTVESFLELLEVMWDNAGGAVELVVVRADCRSLLTLNMMVVEATPDELNRWPRWEYR